MTYTDKAALPANTTASTAGPRVIGRLPVTQDDVDDVIEGARYPASSARLLRREMKELVDRVLVSLKRDGQLDRAIEKEAASYFRARTRNQYGEDAARINPRYGQAMALLFTERLPDGTEGYREEVVWRTNGASRWIADEYLYSIASARDRAEWNDIRNAAILRRRLSRSSR